MNLAIVYGTRPEFLKLCVLISSIKNIESIKLTIIRINQHTDLQEDIGCYDDNINIDILCNNRLNNLGANILCKLPKYIQNCTHLLAQGDTATTYYSLLTAFQMKKKCIHLEAGMRTYDLDNPYPEEAYRQMISRITDIHLCPSEIEKQYLMRENVRGNIYVVGNTILDLVRSYQFPNIMGEYVVITLHRRENWENYDKYLEAIVNMISLNKNLIFFFLMHPNPYLKNKILKFMEDKCVPNLILKNQIPHKELIKLLSTSYCVITDSGGIQEEANFLGKHMYVLRKLTERSSIPHNKITILGHSELDTLIISDEKHDSGYEYGDGYSVNKIIKILLGETLGWVLTPAVPKPKSIPQGETMPSFEITN